MACYRKMSYRHSDFRTLVNETKELINILSHFAGVLTDRIHDVKAEVTRIAHARQDSHVEGAHRASGASAPIAATLLMISWTD
mgnify:FL=1